MGQTSWALPGIVRIGVPGATERNVSVAGSAGYGYTESQRDGDSAHHRIFGSAAVALTPIRSLDVALRFDGRYDVHGDDGTGSHGAGVGDPRLLARYGSALGDGSVRLGAEAVLWVPGKDAPSFAFDATTLDARLLAAFTPRSGPTIALLAGFRLDNSGKAAPDPSRLRFGDRVALGLSDSNAVLAGAGVSIPLGKTEILGEASADFLVGSDAPSLGKSPIRVDLGARHALSSQLAVEGLAEVSASGRPDLTATAPLVPLEPRISVVFGLRYRLPFDQPAPAETAPTETKPAPPPVAPAARPTAAPLSIKVVGPDGPLSGATVEIRQGDAKIAATDEGAGMYRSAEAPFGKVTLAVTAEGFAPVERDVEHGPKTESPLEVKLEAVAPSGQLRGLVRSFSGKGLAATVRVEPLGNEVKADAQGNFAVDLPPGDYEVTIALQGFKAQKRKIKIDQNGVTVLNAELFEGK